MKPSIGTGFAILVCAMSVKSYAQSPGQAAAPEPSLAEFAKTVPGCNEVQNNCQVCLRGADNEFHCSNVAIACSPNGEWRCISTAAPYKKAK
ncbi:MAG: hypothetical protein ACLPPF_08110 [Rhodomicrobium sp.]